MTPRVRLDRDRVGALTLRKQRLGADSAATDAVSVVDELIGLHATLPTSPYLQLLARMRSFTREQLDALLDSGRVVKLPGMRGTIFIESAELVPLVFAATRELSVRGGEQFLAADGITLPDYERIARRVEHELGTASLSARQLREALGLAHPLTSVLVVMCDQGRLVRWRGAAGWHSAQPTYRRFAAALPSVRLDEWDGAAAVAELINCYIHRYGPVTARDVAWWTGLRTAVVRDAIASLPDVCTVAVDGFPGPFLMHEPDVADVSSSVPAAAGEVALLPVLDPYLQGYRDRSRWVDARHLPLVVDRGGNATSVILVDARVVGIWDFVTKPTAELRILLFGTVPASTRRRIHAAAESVAAFLADRACPIVEVSEEAIRATDWLLSPLRLRR